ncbi:MAG TPA: AraC family transcriptional regulator [Dongiaceae bacterium]|nr:AraC family transcriptional regulator [Dongiaceae bacterium]
MTNSIEQPVQSPRPRPALSPETGWVSMRHLQHMVQSGRAAGLEMDQLLALAGLDDDRLADADARVPLTTLERLLAALQRDHADRLPGIHLANAIQPATLGALGFILQACSTFADMLDVVQRYNGMLSNIGHASVQPLPGLVQVSWECRAGSPQLQRHASEYVMGTIMVVARLLAPGNDIMPAAVHFPHARPQRAERVRDYFDFFRCPVHFDKPVAAVLFPASLLTLRLPHGDAALKELLERHAQNLLQQRTQPSALVDDVRRLLTALILDGAPTKVAVAQQLGMSTRSLHRHLQDNGTCYQDVLHQVRLEQARGLLEKDLSSGAIASRLGFHSRQAFLRWFRQHTDLTPSAFRQQMQGQFVPDAPFDDAVPAELRPAGIPQGESADVH